jgi:hypothetical protein
MIAEATTERENPPIHATAPESGGFVQRVLLGIALRGPLGAILGSHSLSELSVAAIDELMANDMGGRLRTSSPPSRLWAGRFLTLGAFFILAVCSEGGSEYPLIDDRDPTL